MKGIILAAGRGSRMGDLTDNLPKCRTVLHGKELLQWQIDSFCTAAINEIAVVRGYLAETFTFDFTYFENPRWEDTNMVSSLMCAKEWLVSDICITSYSDIVYSADAIERLKLAQGDIVLTYDPNWKELWSIRFDDPLSDAESFRLDNGKVIEIGKKVLSMQEIEGQYMGLVKYTPQGWKSVCDFLAQFNQSEVDRMDMTMLLQGLIEVGVNIQGVPITDKWFEVDSASDLKNYESMSFSLTGSNQIC